MALDLGVTYAGKVDADTAEYPFGLPRNITTPGDDTGTPLEKAWMKDLYGFLHGLLVAASIVPSGTADDVIDSQYRDALEVLLAQRSELDVSAFLDAISPGSALIPVTGNRFPLGFRRGFAMERISSQTLKIHGHGYAKSADGLTDIEREFDVLKLLNATYADGSSVGGIAAGAFPASGWLWCFAMVRADGEVDYILDDNYAGSNIDADAAVIAAGYAFGDTNRRAIQQVYYDGAALIDFTVPLELDGDYFPIPQRIRWAVPFEDYSGGIATTPRQKLILAHAPPNAFVEFNAFFDSSNSGTLYLSEFGQDDTAPGSGALTLARGNNDDTANVAGLRMLTGPEGEIYARRSGLSSLALRICVQGYESLL